MKFIYIFDKTILQFAIRQQNEKIVKILLAKSDIDVNLIIILIYQYSIEFLL